MFRRLYYWRARSRTRRWGLHRWHRALSRWISLEPRIRSRASNCEFRCHSTELDSSERPATSRLCCAQIQWAPKRITNRPSGAKLSNNCMSFPSDKGFIRDLFLKALWAPALCSYLVPFLIDFGFHLIRWARFEKALPSKMGLVKMGRRKP